MKFPAVVRAAARQACNRPPDSSDTRKIEKAIRAFVNKTPRPFPCREGKIVAALFVANVEIMARRAPFASVRQDAPLAGAELREKVRQFMTQRPIDLGESMLAEPRIQRDQFPAIIGVAGARFQKRVPFDANFTSNARCACRGQKVMCYGLQSAIASVLL